MDVSGERQLSHCDALADSTVPRIACFVLSGGVGSRLWPLSREDNPKQFHDLAGHGSLLARTLRRLKARPGGETLIYVIGSERHAERIGEEISNTDLAGGCAIFEPVGRNTAAAVATATLETLAAFGDELVLIVPSDHDISTDDQFWRSVSDGIDAASAGRIVLFGVRPTRAETGFGYVETASLDSGVFDVARFVEKPDAVTAEAYLNSGRFFWNAGIFLFKASTMAAAFETFQPEIWAQAKAAFRLSKEDETGRHLPEAEYAAVPSISLDYAILERVSDIALVPARFHWSDVGSWQSLLQAAHRDASGNVVSGDVVALDCHNSYLRSDGRLLSVIGLKDVAVVETPDATFIAPIDRSQQVRAIVEQLEVRGRTETRFTAGLERVMERGAFRSRVKHWLLQEAMPFWSTKGVDDVHGGFHETLDFAGMPLGLPKRIRTMARQVYAFAVASQRGWTGPADAVISHGLAFMSRGRTDRGGWARALNVDGSVADATEDAYDHACVLLALAHAHACGDPDAERLGRETLAFIDTFLSDPIHGGFLENTGQRGERRSNPHMHMLEAFLAWNSVTGEADFLGRAEALVDLFRRHFFDRETWTLGEFFDELWRPVAGERGQWTEPGHHFEWAALLIDVAERTGQYDLKTYARKLYSSAISHGLNRATGLAYGAVSREAMPLDRTSRSWPQAEALKAVIALNRVGGVDLGPEIEQRVARLFRWHIDAAPTGMWIDKINERGRARATEVPASIFYHLVTALAQYLDATELRPAGQVSERALHVAGLNIDRLQL